MAAALVKAAPVLDDVVNGDGAIDADAAAAALHTVNGALRGIAQ